MVRRFIQHEKIWIRQQQASQGQSPLLAARERRCSLGELILDEAKTMQGRVDPVINHPSSSCFEGSLELSLFLQQDVQRGFIGIGHAGEHRLQLVSNPIKFVEGAGRDVTNRCAIRKDRFLRQ